MGTSRRKKRSHSAWNSLGARQPNQPKQRGPAVPLDAGTSSALPVAAAEVDAHCLLLNSADVPNVKCTSFVDVEIALVDMEEAVRVAVVACAQLRVSCLATAAQENAQHEVVCAHLAGDSDDDGEGSCIDSDPPEGLNAFALLPTCSSTSTGSQLLSELSWTGMQEPGLACLPNVARPLAFCTLRLDRPCVAIDQEARCLGITGLDADRHCSPGAVAPQDQSPRRVSALGFNVRCQSDRPAAGPVPVIVGMPLSPKLIAYMSRRCARTYRSVWWSLEENDQDDFIKAIGHLKYVGRHGDVAKAFRLSFTKAHSFVQARVRSDGKYEGLGTHIDGASTPEAIAEPRVVSGTRNEVLLQAYDQHDDTGIDLWTELVRAGASCEDAEEVLLAACGHPAAPPPAGVQGHARRLFLHARGLIN